MVGVTVLCISTAFAWGHVMKFMTQHAQGMEDRVWLWESWICSNSRDHVQDAEWVGHGIYHVVGGSSFPRGSETLTSCEVLAQGILTASKAPATHWEAWWPRVSLNYHARRYQFMFMKSRTDTKHLYWEIALYCHITLLVLTFTIPFSPGL